MADVRIKLQVPTLTIDAFCVQDGYRATIPNPPLADIPNPESKSYYVARRLREYLEGTAAAGKVVSVVNARKTEDAALASSIAIVVPVEVT